MTDKPFPSFSDWTKARHPHGWVLARRTASMVAKYGPEKTFFSQAGYAKEERAYEKMIADSVAGEPLPTLVQFFLAETARERPLGRVEDGLRLALERAVANQEHVPYDDHDDDGDLARFLAGVVGVIDATRCEQSYIYEHATRHGAVWKSDNVGRGVPVGFVGDDPVYVSLSTATVNGGKVLFYEATSKVVDHDLVRAWLEKHLPATARVDGQLNHSDATNWHNVLPRAVQEAA